MLSQELYDRVPGSPLDSTNVKGALKKAIFASQKQSLPQNPTRRSHWRPVHDLDHVWHLVR
jgi:hypothetical protein